MGGTDVHEIQHEQHIQITFGKEGGCLWKGHTRTFKFICNFLFFKQGNRSMSICCFFCFRPLSFSYIFVGMKFVTNF